MIQKFEEIDDSHQELLEEAFLGIISYRKNAKYKDIITVLSSFIGNVNFIKNGIYDLYESQNVYSTRILFRSLIEHFLRFQYLVLRYCELKDGSVFKEYIEYSRYTDEYQYGLSLKSMNRILDSVCKKTCN
jgi:hypothetical protein